MVIDLLPLIAGILSLVLGGIVLVNGTTRSDMRWPFGLFAGSVGVWAAFISFFSLTSQVSLARIFVDIYYIAALLIAYSFLIFSLSYSSIKLSQLTRIIALLPWVVMSVLITIPYLFIGDIDMSGVKNVELIQPMYLLYAIFFIIYVLIGLWALGSRALSARRRDAHRKVLAISLTICLIGGGYFNLILPWWGNYTLIALGPLFSFLMVASVFYAIARHGLFDIRQAVVRTVTYLLSLATLAGVYLFVAFVIFNQLLGQTSNVGQTVLNVILTLLLVFIFQPVKQFFDKLTNRLFYKDSYNVDDFFEKLNRVLTSTIDLRKLLERVAREIQSNLKSEQVYFFVYTSGHHHMQAGTKHATKLPRHDASLFSSVYGDMPKMVVVSMLPEHSPVRRMMISHKLEIAMPLIQNDVLIGYVCLGEHRTSHYTSRDMRVLETIADELGIAIQNALSILEVKKLNETLQQRVDEATKELRTSNAQLQKLDEAKDEFISMASHQLRTPLTSIKGYISMLVEGDVGKVTPDQKHLLDEAFISSERMVRLIGDFLNVSRLQTGKFVIEKQPVDLAKVVGQEIDSLLPNAAARGLKFTYKAPKNIPQLSLDDSKIRQVIMNFADNAIYYSKEKSTIKVELKADTSWVEFTVKDTGIGVPESEKDHLFSKFFRATNARKQRPDGTGVGLFLAKKVIDSHDGQIVFESKEGKGSTFGFRLPIAKLRVTSNTKQLDDKPHDEANH